CALITNRTDPWWLLVFMVWITRGVGTEARRRAGSLRPLDPVAHFVRWGLVEQPDGPTNAETRQAKFLSGLGGRTRADAPNQMRHVFSGVLHAEKGVVAAAF